MTEARGIEQGADNRGEDTTRQPADRDTPVAALD